MGRGAELYVECLVLHFENAHCNFAQIRVGAQEFARNSCVLSQDAKKNVAGAAFSVADTLL
jgi:hypothetical protein